MATCWILEDEFTTFLDVLYENGKHEGMSITQLYLSFIKYMIEDLDLGDDVMIGYIINKHGDIDKEFREMVEILLSSRIESLDIEYYCEPFFVHS
jgi:hypothetical protein